MALRSRSRRAALALALLVFGVISPVTASVTSAAGTTKPEIRLSGEAARRLLSAYDHTYKLRETVPLYANKVGPFHNPSEVRRERHGGAFPAERNAAMIDWDGWPMPTNTPVACL